MSREQHQRMRSDDLPCFDCGKPTCPDDYYMVTLFAWTQAGMTPTTCESNEFLCIACLEKRLGRQLTRADFVDVPLNVLTARSGTLLHARLEPDGTNVGLSPVDW